MGYWTYDPYFKPEDDPTGITPYRWSIAGVLANHASIRLNEWLNDHREELHEIARNSGE